VSLVSTVLNERRSVGRLVETLARQTRPPDEVVVVDGGSSDGTPEAVRALAAAGLLTSRRDTPGETGPLPPQPERAPPLRLIEAPGTNISQGRNRAVAAASHDLIAAADAGVELHPQWLERLIAPLEASARVQAVSGFFVSAPQSLWELALGATTLPEAAEIDPARFLPSSRSVAFRRNAWQAAAGYPEWLDYGEDLVFDFALIARGARPRFQPRAVVRFRPRTTPLAFFRQYYRYARGDGKADLWRKRHAVRYATYLGGALLAWRASTRGDRVALALLGAGGAAYLKQPLVRLSAQARSPAELLGAAALVPIVRLVGDVAKMLGYPVGVLWRFRSCRL
jgi:glycosyltransferase involved in cell wall biosynthesis